MTPELFAAHRWLAVPLVLGVAAVLWAIVSLIHTALDWRASRVYHVAPPVIPMGPHPARSFSLPAKKGIEAARRCDGTSDDCTGWAHTTRDTSDGYCPLEHFCLPCAAAYDDWRANYDGPDTAIERAR